MPQSLTRKLIDAHLVAGKAVAGEEIGVRADQILLTDTNGIQSWLQFEAMGFPRVVPPRVVTYIDHQVFQVDSRNSDDHRYMQTASRKYGAVFSKPGNGICHQVHMETYSIPGLTRLGRGDDWRPVQADDDAEYDAQIELDLSAVTPLVALPGSPDKVVPVEEVAGTAIEQVTVGSCTNGSWHDMASVTNVVRGRRVHPSLSFVLFPGSHRILETMAREGLLADLLAAGVLVSEPSG